MIISLSGLSASAAGELVHLLGLCFPHERKPWSADQWQDFCARPESVGFAATGSDDPSSSLEAVLIAQVLDQEAEIITLAVHPEKRRQGLARCLIEELTKTIANNLPPNNPKRRILLEVAESSFPARQLYESMGFQVFHRRPGYYPDYYKGRSGSADALLMEKRMI